MEIFALFSVQPMMVNKDLGTKYYTNKQRAILWSAFSKTTHAKPEEREFFAKQMGLSSETGAQSVQIWFQNQRNLALQPIMVNEDQIRLQNGQNEKRQYTKHTAGQKVILWRAYAQNKFPNKQMEEELVRKLGLPTETGVKTVQNWFKNRRSDGKKRKFEPIKSSSTTNQPQQVATPTNTPPQSVSPPEKLHRRGQVNLPATPTSQQIQGGGQVNWAATNTNQQFQGRGQVTLAATPPFRQIQGCGKVNWEATITPKPIQGRGQVNQAPTFQQPHCLYMDLDGKKLVTSNLPFENFISCKGTIHIGNFSLLEKWHL